MTDQTVNTDEQRPPDETGLASDAQTEAADLDASLAEMASVMVESPDDDDFDFDGMFAEVGAAEVGAENPPQDSSTDQSATPSAETLPPPEAAEEPAAAEPHAEDEAAATPDVATQLDEIEAAVAAAIDEADAEAIEEAEHEQAAADAHATEAAPDAGEPAAEEPEPEAPSPPSDPDTVMHAAAEALEREGASGSADISVEEDDSAAAQTAAPAPGPETAADPASETGAAVTDAASTPDHEPESPEPQTTTEPARAGSGEDELEGRPESSQTASSDSAPPTATPESNIAQTTGPADPDGNAPTAGHTTMTKASAVARRTVSRLGPLVQRVAGPQFARCGLIAARGLESLAASYSGRSKAVRHSIAWIAIWTLFNASVVWVYLGLFRSSTPGSGAASGTQITGAAPAPVQATGLAPGLDTGVKPTSDGP